jgi:hypothetical protein
VEPIALAIALKPLAIDEKDTEDGTPPLPEERCRS